MSMYYYLCRKRPSHIHGRRAIIRSERSWDVEMIMRSERELLCHYSADAFDDTLVWRFEDTTKQEYDFLDAFGIPIMDEHDAEQLQDIAFENGRRMEL